jgi:acyl-CoA synthetase (AMP-forming)/AMP-acid ligase II/acyl carrier protein
MTDVAKRGEVLRPPAVERCTDTAGRATDPCGSSIGRLLELQAERSPGAIALAAPGRAPLTYGRLWTQIRGAVDALNAIELGRNDPVALVVPNGPEAAVAFLAVAAATTAAPLNPAHRAMEFDSYLRALHAKALIVQRSPGSAAVAAAEAQGIPIVNLLPMTDEPAGIFRLSGARGTRAAVPGYATADDVGLLLHTSGTTSRPKLVPLTHANLCNSAHNIRSALALDDHDRCLNVMPLFHIHGLVGALLASLTSGASVVCTPGFYAPEFFAWLDALRPTWYTAVPTMHQAILKRAAAHRAVIDRAPLRFVRSCSAPLLPRVAAELEAALGVPAIEAYGMTEAAHQITSNPLPPAERRTGSVGVPTGPEVAILDEAGRPRSPGESGEIAIRGTTVMAGYAADPAANAAAFSHGWLRTGDQGYLDADGYLFITGRLKEIINRAGEKIAPPEIEQALLEHPSVAQAVAFAVPHPELGEEVGAAIVLREGALASAAALQEFTATRLADFKVPRRIVFLAQLPTGATGKVSRAGLAAHLGMTDVEPAGATDVATCVAPSTPLEEALARIWAEVLDVDRVGVHDGFFDLGGDSMLAVRLVVRVNEELDADLPLSSLFVEASTVAQLARAIERSHAGDLRVEGAGIASLPETSVRRISAPRPTGRRRHRAGLGALVKAMLFLPQVLPQAPLRPLEWVTGKPYRQTIRVSVSGETISADLYTPTRGGPHAGLVVFLGGTPQGRSDPRAIQVGDAFARSGFVTLVHWSPTTVESIEPRDVDGVVAAFQYLVQRPDVDACRAGLFGLCTGASYALIAAARPAIAEGVAFVNAFAPYFSRRDLIRSTLSATAFSEAGTRPWEVPWATDPIHRYRWEQMLLAAIPDRAERRRVGHTIREGGPQPVGLSPEASAVFQLLKGVTFERTNELLDRLPLAFLAKLEQASPRGQLDGLRAEVLVMHSVADYLVPVEESRRLVAALGSHVPTRYTEFGLFDHVNLTGAFGPVTFVRELAKLIAHTRAVMRYACG